MGAPRGAYDEEVVLGCIGQEEVLCQGVAVLHDILGSANAWGKEYQGQKLASSLPLAVYQTQWRLTDAEGNRLWPKPCAMRCGLPGEEGVEQHFFLLKLPSYSKKSVVKLRLRRHGT